MKAFTFFDDPYSDSDHPENLNKIIEYLEANGNINCSIYCIEDYYSQFSYEYYKVSWEPLSISTFLTENDYTILDGFSNWLSKVDI